MRVTLLLTARLAVAVLFTSLIVCSCTGSKGTKRDNESAQLISHSTYAARMVTHPESEGEFLKGYIVNSRYLFAPFAQRNDGTLDHLVLRETVHLEESAAQERENGRVSVEAFPAARAGESALLWKFESEGIGGSVFDSNLYSLQQVACCGSSDRTVQYSLNNGIELFSSTIPIAFIEHAGTRVKRYIGFDDGYGKIRPPEMSSDDSILGVLYYSSESELLHKAAIKGRRTRECRAGGTVIHLGSNRSDNLQVTLFRYEATPTFDGIEIVVDLECMADGAKEQFRVPILGDLPDTSQSTTTAGIQVSTLN